MAHPLSARLPARPAWSRGWLEDHFSPAVVARVEVLVGVRCLTQWQLMRDNEGRLRATGRDEVTQLPVVRLHVALAGANLLALEPEKAVLEGDLALLVKRVPG